MAKKKKPKKKSKFVEEIGGERFLFGKCKLISRNRTTGQVIQDTITRQQALRLLQEDEDPTLYPPENGW